jgi:hypothetical protein
MESRKYHDAGGAEALRNTKGDTVNRFQTLARRLRPAHHSWQAAVADLTLEQANYQERRGVLPITFSLMHLVTTEDLRTSERLLGKEPLWKRGNWAEKIGVNVSAVFRGTPIEVAESLRFKDIDAWRAFQTAVFTQTMDALSQIADDRYDEVVFAEIPDSFRGLWLHLLSGDGPVALGDYLETVVYHHSIRHLGELEHARALVGLHGVGG